MDFQGISHFNRFNAFRFIAASLVLLHHAESLREQFGLFNLKAYGLFRNGSNAVTFFFVLSGFLITYLLLKELKASGTIGIKRFYLKRVFRIWPLYYLLVIIGALIQPVLIKSLGLTYQMPYTFGETWYYFVFFFPGLVTFYFGSHLLEPLWSIGVEEIFYLIWAPLFRFFKKRLIWVFMGVILLKVFLFLWVDYNTVPPVIRYLVRILQFESMALGALAAYVLFYFGERFPEKIIRRIRIAASLLTLLLISYRFMPVPVIETFLSSNSFAPLVKSLVFALLLGSIAFENRPSRFFDSKIANYLGDISYGIYMYHLLILTGVVEILKVVRINPLLDSLLYYVLAFAFTLVIAGLSRRYFEARFLRMKSPLH